ncbi:MAG: serine kinase [bacterium]|nr:serine kinase [bacterium]
MTLQELVQKLELLVRSAKNELEHEVTGGYASDLLSDVMANSNPGNIWLTIQIHPNIIAVAVLKELTGIIISNGREPEKETIAKAEREKIPILTSSLPTYELAGKLYKLLNH